MSLSPDLRFVRGKVCHAIVEREGGQTVAIFVWRDLTAYAFVMHHSDVSRTSVGSKKDEYFALHLWSYSPLSLSLFLFLFSSFSLSLSLSLSPSFSFSLILLLSSLFSIVRCEKAKLSGLSLWEVLEREFHIGNPPYSRQDWMEMLFNFWLWPTETCQRSSCFCIFLALVDSASQLSETFLVLLCTHGCVFECIKHMSSLKD